MATYYGKFEIIRGTSKRLNIWLYQFLAQNIPIDLTYVSTAKLYVATSRNSSSLSLEKTLTVDAAVLGRLYYDFVPADTVDLDARDYIAEVHLTMQSGLEYRTFQPFIFRIIERVKA